MSQLHVSKPLSVCRKLDGNHSPSSILFWYPSIHPSSSRLSSTSVFPNPVLGESTIPGAGREQKHEVSGGGPGGPGWETLQYSIMGSKTGDRRDASISHSAASQIWRNPGKQPNDARWLLPISAPEEVQQEGHSGEFNYYFQNKTKNDWGTIYLKRWKPASHYRCKQDPDLSALRWLTLEKADLDPVGLISLQEVISATACCFSDRYRSESWFTGMGEAPASWPCRRLPSTTKPPTSSQPPTRISPLGGWGWLICLFSPHLVQKKLLISVPDRLPTHSSIRQTTA